MASHHRYKYLALFAYPNDIRAPGAKTTIPLDKSSLALSLSSQQLRDGFIVADSFLFFLTIYLFIH